MLRDNVVEIFGKYTLPQDIAYVCLPGAMRTVDAQFKSKAKDKLYTKSLRLSISPTLPSTNTIFHLGYDSLAHRTDIGPPDGLL